MSQQDLDAAFDSQSTGGGGAPSYAFPKVAERNKLVPEIGHVVSGEIIDLFKTVVKDIETGEPKLDKNGNEQLQVNITLRTAARNWELAINPGKDEDGNELPPSEDNGDRRLYAKYRMLQAVAKAVKDAGQTGAPKVGGKLAVRVKSLDWSAVDRNPTRNPLPDYDAKYEPPAPAAPAGLDDAFSNAAPREQAAPAQQAAPAAAPAAAGGWSDEPPF